MNDFFDYHHHPSLVPQPQKPSSRRDLSLHNRADGVSWLYGMKFYDPTGVFARDRVARRVGGRTIFRSSSALHLAFIQSYYEAKSSTSDFLERVSMEEASRLTLFEAIRFRREIGKRLGRDEDRTLRSTVRDATRFTELGAALNMGKVIEVVFQIIAFQSPEIVVQGENAAMYLTDAQVGEHLQLLSQAFENALAG